MNYTCNIWIKDHEPVAFYILNHACDDFPKERHVTTILYSFLAGILMVLAGILYLSFNSVRVLRYQYSVPTISNNVWAIYFFVASIRSIVLAIAYSQRFQLGDYILTNWIVGSFEIMALTLALKYQLRYRSQIKEPDGFQQKAPTDKNNDKKINTPARRKSKKEDEMTYSVEVRRNQFARYIQNFKIQEIAIVVVFVLIVIAVILFVHDTNRTMVWFWVYVALSILMLAGALVYATTIAIKSGYDKPSCLARLFIIMAVLLCIPERIPIFVWKYCIGGETCWHNRFDVFDLFLLLKMVSAVAIFLASIKEYYRYKEPAQYNILSEVQAPVFYPRNNDDKADGKVH